MNKTHVIITYAGTHYPITTEQEIKLRDLKAHKQFKIDGAMIMGSNIAEVMPIWKYYETYPDKRPPITDQYKNIEGTGMIGIIRKAKRTDALEGMIRGIKKYIASDKYQGMEKPKKILEAMELKLNQIKTI